MTSSMISIARHPKEAHRDESTIFDKEISR
jgi:hypothetical protein